jgi:hypothetical protein
MNILSKLCVKRWLPYLGVAALALTSCQPSTSPATSETISTTSDNLSYATDSVVTEFFRTVVGTDSVTEARLQIILTLESEEGPVLQAGNYFTADLVVKSGGEWNFHETTQAPEYVSSNCGEAGAQAFKLEKTSGGVAPDQQSAKYAVKLTPTAPLCTGKTVQVTGGLIVVVEEILPTEITEVHFENVALVTPDGAQPVPKK